MSEEKSCQRCGSCCRVIPLSTKGMAPAYRQYLLARGLKEDQGFILIPHECQHLVLESARLDSISKVGDSFEPNLSERVYACDIYYSPDRPKVCQQFHGQKRIGPWAIYVPEECNLKKGVEKIADNWDNPRNVDPVLVEQAVHSVEELQEAIKRKRSDQRCGRLVTQTVKKKGSMIPP